MNTEPRDDSVKVQWPAADIKNFLDGIGKQNKFREELESLINRHSQENGSNTPDFILATYLFDCLAAFDKATKRRTEWYEATPPDPTCPEPHDAYTPSSDAPVPLTQ